MSDDIKIVGLANPRKSTGTSFKIIAAIIGILVLAFGVMAGIYLVGQQQDIRERASTQCPEIEACPMGNEPSLLISCTPTEAQSTCNSQSIGRKELCGGAQYCCNGTAWTTNMSACAIATASPTPTAIPTSVPTSVPTATPTTATNVIIATGTPTVRPTSTNSQQVSSTPTAMPIPETGASSMTILGVGVGVMVIITSVFLAL